MQVLTFRAYRKDNCLFSDVRREGEKKLRNIRSRGTTWNIVIQKGKIYNIKSKVIAFIINFRGNKTIRNREM